MIRRWIVLIWSMLFVFSGNMAKGSVDTKERHLVPPAEMEKMLSIKNPLVKEVFQRYQSINTYHAVWTMTRSGPNNTNEPNCAIWEVAFDRLTKRVLFFFGLQSPDEKKPLKFGQLFIADGKMMHTALSAGDAVELQKQSIPIADPNELTYRHMRKNMFFRPFDLPLMFSEFHFMEVVEGQIKEIRTLEESESLLGFEVLPEYGETSGVFWVDPKTMLIQKFYFMHHSGQGPVFKIKTIEINQPIDDALFNFEKKVQQGGSCLRGN